MTSLLDIYNRALGHIGSDQQVQSPSERTKQAINCRTFYETCRDEVLVDFPWNFARRVVALAMLDEDPPPGWGYIFAYPSDCLKALRVTDVYGARVPISPAFGWYVDLQGRWSLPIGMPKIPYQIMQSTSGQKAVVCDLAEPFLFYTTRVFDLNLFDATAVLLLSRKLACEIVSPMTGGDIRRLQAMQSLYAVERAKAGAANLNEAQDDTPQDPGSVRARA